MPDEFSEFLVQIKVLQKGLAFTSRYSGHGRLLQGKLWATVHFLIVFGSNGFETL